MQFEGVNNAIVELAMSITKEQKEEMHALQNMEPYQVVNASYEADAGFLKEEGELTHLIGVLTTKEDVSGGLVKVPVEECAWAVFPNEDRFPPLSKIPWHESIPNGCPLLIMRSLTCLLFLFPKWMRIKRIARTAKFWTPVRKKK
jgi:AraC family transcriptional regulator